MPAKAGKSRAAGGEPAAATSDTRPRRAQGPQSKTDSGAGLQVQVRSAESPAGAFSAAKLKRFTFSCDSRVELISAHGNRVGLSAAHFAKKKTQCDARAGHHASGVKQNEKELQ